MLLASVGFGRRLLGRVGAVPAIGAHANANNFINATRQQSKYHLTRSRCIAAFKLIGVLPSRSPI
jgi:hypothetical protein